MRCKKLFLTLLLFNIVLTAYSQNIEIPSYKFSDTIIRHSGYTLSYSEEHEQAEWVAYELTLEEIPILLWCSPPEEVSESKPNLPILFSVG